MTTRRVEPLTTYEKNFFGANAVRDPVTGFVLEQGSGAHDRATQSKNHQRNLRNPAWCKLYALRDPLARINHPELFDGGEA